MKLTYGPSYSNQYNSLITEITGDDYRRAQLSLKDVSEDDFKKLESIVKLNVYAFGMLGANKECNVNNKLSHYKYSSPLKRNNVTISRNDVFNFLTVFINGPKTVEICEEILKLMPEDNIEPIVQI